MGAIRPFFIIRYKGKYITKDISPMLLDVSFEDSLEGKAGSLTIRLENRKGLWTNDWFPKVMDVLSLKMGYEEDSIIDCGTFYIDQLEGQGDRNNGDIFVINALSNLPSAKYNHELTKPYHGSFKDLAHEIGSGIGMKIEGSLTGELKTVAKGNGLAILMHEAKKLGKIMKTLGDTIMFYDLDDIKADTYKVTINRKDVKSYRFVDRASGRYNSCECRHWSRNKKKEIRGSYTLGIAGGGKAVIWEEVEDVKEAQERAKRWLEDKNKQGVEFILDTVGNVNLKSGVAVELEGFGVYDEYSYYVAHSSHSYSRNNGYETSINLER